MDKLQAELSNNQSDSIEQELELAHPINTNKVIYGILNLERRKEESIFDSINHFNKCCPYCGNSLYEGHIRNKIEIDHFFPISKGGQDFPWNILPICQDCNRKKRDKMPYDFLSQIKYQQCYEYLVSIKTKFANDAEIELYNFEMLKKIILKFKPDLYKYQHIPPLKEIVNIILPGYFTNEHREQSEKDNNSLVVITDFFAVISQKTIDNFFQFNKSKCEVRIHISKAIKQYQSIVKNTANQYNKNEIESIFYNKIPGLIDKNKVVLINSKSIRCAVYDYSIMPDEWRDIFKILRIDD